MRVEVFTNNYLYIFLLITAIKLAASLRCLLILKIREEISHELLGIMLLYWMKLFNNLCFQMLNLDNSLSAKHSLVEQVHTVAVIKIISQSLKLFITCIGLSKIVITHFRDWSKTLKASIQIAVETIIFHSLNSFCKIFQILQLYLTCSNRKRYWRYSIDVAWSCLLKAGIDW
jgi:hypothetical protein